MRLALIWINRVQVNPGVQNAQHWYIWNYSHCLVFLLTIGPRMCLLLSFFLSWVTKTQPNQYCDWAEGEHLMHHLGPMKLLQHFAFMRLPRDTFARRRLTFTRFKRCKFHYTSPASTIYLILWYLFGCLWSTTHVASIMETNCDDTVINCPTTVWRRVMRHEIWRLRQLADYQLADYQEVICKATPLGCWSEFQPEPRLDLLCNSTETHQ